MKTEEQRTELPPSVASALPPAVWRDYERVSAQASMYVEEIRLRRGQRADFLTARGTLTGEHCLTAGEMEDTVYRLCGGSVYAHADTLCEGYIRLADGCRAGVCGRVVCEGDHVRAVREVTSLVIRLARKQPPSYRSLTDRFLRETGGGMLLVAPPGVGKTTVLRALAWDLAGRCRRRVALVDTRGELSFGKTEETLRLDVLDGYPRGQGLDIALRFLNPEVILCDEIGSAEEVRALREHQSGGVPVIASAHGDTVTSLLRRPGMAELHTAGVFSLYVRLERPAGASVCTWQAWRADEVTDAV